MSYADIVVFEPDTIGHAGKPTDPRVPTTGIDAVLLAGEPVVHSGAFSGPLAWPGSAPKPAWR
jgi:N-acyl-D-amino-acid deacylase